MTPRPRPEHGAHDRAAAPICSSGSGPLIAPSHSTRASTGALVGRQGRRSLRCARQNRASKPASSCSACTARTSPSSTASTAPAGQIESRMEAEGPGGADVGGVGRGSSVASVRRSWNSRPPRRRLALVPEPIPYRLPSSARAARRRWKSTTTRRAVQEEGVDGAEARVLSAPALRTSSFATTRSFGCRMLRSPR